MGELCMFSIGERVIYGAIGVCEISDITLNELTGVTREYYILRPVDTDKSVIYVPTDNEKLTSRMRAVPSSKELHKLLSDIKDSKFDWIENNLERNEKFHEILNDGNIKENVKLLRTLHARSQDLSLKGRHLQKADERIYKDCSKLLCSEFSSILNIEQSQVVSMVLDYKK